MKQIFFSYSLEDLKAHDVLASVRGKIGTLGYEAISHGETEAGSLIGNEVSERLKRASLVVAILNEQSSNVLFEVGYSFALGKKLILVADLVGGLPFDLKSVPAIDYSFAPTEIAFEIMKRIDSLDGGAARSETNLPTELGQILTASKQRPEVFEKISNESFENAVRNAFTERGFIVENANPEQDHGFDFRILNRARDKSVLVEVKKHNSNSKISIAAVQQLLGAVHAYRDSAALLICTSDFTASARGFASSQQDDIRLWTITELEEFSQWRLGEPTIEDVLSFPIRPSIFKGDISKLGNVDIEAPIRTGREPSCHYYSEPFAEAAKRAEDSGDQQSAATYRFLQVLVSFHPSFDNSEKPYVPWFVMEGRRGLIPSDLSANDVLVLRDLAPLASDPSLRARLFDVLWELNRDHKACGEASESYVQAAERLNTSEQWVHAAECYQRSVQLAAKLGREKEVFQRASESIQKAARASALDEAKFRCARYLRIIFDNKCGDPSEFATIANDFARRANAAGDQYQARAYWQIEADFQKAARNAPAEKSALLAAAETYIAESEKRMQGNTPSAMAAASLLTNGIEALRQAGGARERIDELRARLRGYQEESLKEMGTHSTEVDISEPVEAARKHVSGTDLHTALIRLALGHDLTVLADLRETVLTQAKETPLLHLIGATMVDQKGRVTAQRPGLLNLQGEELERRIEAEMFSNAAQFMWPLRVSCYIEPARLQIFSEHHPTFEELAFLVRDNPFVPSGHETIFLRGIHAGFNGDFLVASHLLIPQIENSIRYVLESNGVDVSNFMSDGTQPVKVLGPLFGMKEIEEFFGESLCFELRGCLIEKTGYDFRNRLAHGFVSERECYSSAAVMVWWLVLRICLLPIYRDITEKS
jgi:hypothetical protein